MRTLVDAIGALRVKLITNEPIVNDPEAVTALDTVLKLAARFEKVLKFYASEDNWIDNEPMLPGVDGLLSQPDKGEMARYALGKH